MRQWARWAALVALLAVSGAPARHEGDKPGEAADTRAMDAALNKSLRDVINQGAVLYNKGDHAGCYRVFQGGLTAARGLLDHHPALQKAVSTSLASAERDPLVWRRAFTLRAALDKVRKGLAGKPEEKAKEKERPPAKDDDMKKEDDKKDDEKKDDKEKVDDKKKEEKKKEVEKKNDKEKEKEADD
jgi:hypothetical protein